MAIIVDEAHCVKKWCISYLFVGIHRIFFVIISIFVLNNNRGDSFRKAFSRLSEVRSIIPNGVKLMALLQVQDTVHVKHWV